MPTLLGLCGLGTVSRPVPTGSAFLNLPVPIGEALRYGIAEYRGVRTARYTYVRSINGPWLLYDNRKDPYQQHNLCGLPQARGIQGRLEAELGRWLEALDDGFLPAARYLERDHLSQYLETKFPIGHVASPWGDWESTLHRPAGPFSSRNASVEELLRDPGARAVLSGELPELTNQAVNSERIRTLSLWLIQQFGMVQIPDAKLEVIDRQLAALGAKS
jgi:hypothetical protein